MLTCSLLKIPCLREVSHKPVGTKMFNLHLTWMFSLELNQHSKLEATTEDDCAFSQPKWRIMYTFFRESFLRRSLFWRECLQNQLSLDRKGFAAIHPGFLNLRYPNITQISRVAYRSNYKPGLLHTTSMGIFWFVQP